MVLYLLYSRLDSLLLNLLMFRGKKHNSGNRAANSENSSMYLLAVKRDT